MKYLNWLFSFYINASIHVTFAVLSLVGITLLEYDLKISFSLWALLLFGTISAYNFVKYASVAGLHHRSLTNSLKVIQVFSFICFGLLLFFMFHVALDTLLVLGAFGLLTFLYAVPLLKRKNLRTFGGLKIFVVALVWAGVTVFVPMAEAKMQITTDCWLSFFQRFLMVIVLTLPFEIRDLLYDAVYLKTLPQQLGERKAKLLGIFFLTVTIILEGFKDEISIAHLVSLIAICILMGGFLVLSEKKQTRYFASFWVEGIPIIWFGILSLLLHFLL
ncbi:UbiA prenyltransferase family protein [Ulvibacter antarcticus]|uniref:UbiA prenyltransferase family protein n=1 Tax=Ulvibacter antarcticus TaxID=442714 RepID=A0A3L9YCA5_9FLAO|nr:hypothetical protein [Ulvibacter antarcticus]RMA57127.1 hypothetical protein BXY75_3010 [Ulvibacter antarcticus]